jgi:hypothetical protein
MVQFLGILLASKQFFCETIDFTLEEKPSLVHVGLQHLALVYRMSWIEYDYILYFDFVLSTVCSRLIERLALIAFELSATP